MNDGIELEEENPNKNIGEVKIAQVLKKKSEDIVVTEQEIEDYIKSALSQSSISDEAYKESLQQNGMTEEEYKRELKKQMQIAKLIDENINPKDYEVSKKEVDLYLKENKEAFSDFLEDESLSEMLKARIEQKLSLEKREMLVKKFVEGLS